MMEISQTVSLYITYVEKEGPFLKVWGQTEKTNSIFVEQFLLNSGPDFDKGVGNISIDNLQAGTLVCAKYMDSKYYRARISNASFLDQGVVEVSFLDYGNKDLVPCGNIRSLQNFPSSFISVPPLASAFIFAEAHCPGGVEWHEAILDGISKEIKYREVQCTLLTQAAQYFLVRLYSGGSDLLSLFIARGLMQPISLQAQQAVLLSMNIQRSSLPPPQMVPPTSTGINTYKACTLEPGRHYPVYVSYVNDGPCHFSVQLKQTEGVLAMLMNDINSMTLRLLEDIPIPGTICLARCQEDGNICRAVVTNEVDNQFKVFYVDFGNYEVVPLDALYQIPFKYVIPKVMAIRFSLANVEKSTVTLEMQCAFKQFVDNRLLHMKVLPAPTRMAIPKCDLWDPETKTSALDVVNRAAQNAYPEPVLLNRGFSQLVKVSYVYSCNRFYVQLVSKENELVKLMADLQISCDSNDFMDPSVIKIGLPCCALFEADQQWYRSQIVELLGDNVRVRYIDYGNEELIPYSQLKIIEGEQLTVLRPQAIECCLNGYQNMEEDLQRDGFLEELILERQFTMKVAEMNNKKALVELFDESNYNVASLLLDKLATSKSQVSPMLVQAGNKIEHRKSFSNQNGPREQNYRQDRNPERTNDRNDNSWRNDKKDFRRNDRNADENDRNSWRQNKGSSPNNERFNNKDNIRSGNDRNNKENVSWDDDSGTAKSPENNEWNTPVNNAGYQNNSREKDFNRNKGGRFNKENNWNSDGQKGGGFKKRNNFRKDDSDISSSGSEKGYRGPRTSSRTDRHPHHKKFDNPRNTAFTRNNDITDDSWNVSSVSPMTDAAPPTARFVLYDVVGTVSNVIISWFHNPAHFYCQLADIQDQFKSLMADIQQFYKGRKPESAVVGAPIVGLFPEDSVLYRAQVLDVTNGQYKIYYVDFGNVSNVTKVWPIEKKFMSLPAQAIACSLNEIAPPGDQWPDPDDYSKYFDKDRYVCSFVNKDEEKTYVDLYHGDEDIKLQLIQNGLAVSTQRIIPEIEIPLLLGQQFRAVVKSINNLSDIIIALECGVALSCKMHNLEEAATTDETNLKRFLERPVIIYVDNVIDDRLEITLYDTEGCKIEVVSPDEGACDMIELPCPVLVLNSTLTGYVPFVGETYVFIQPTEYAETVVYLLDLMYESYENMTQEDTIIPEVELLYAVNSEDGNWYRARVINISDTQASVFYIDYGNSEDVEFGKLRQLKDKFLEICTLCIQVFVTVPTDIFVDKEVFANIYYGEKGWEGTVELQAQESSATESASANANYEKGAADKQVLNEHEIVIPVENQEPVDFVEPCSDNVQNGTLVFVTVPTDIFVDKEVFANIYYGEKGWEGTVELQAQESSATESASANANYEKGAADKQVLNEHEIVIPVENQEPVDFVEPCSDNVQNGTLVSVSHIDSPNEFYLQLAESLTAIDELQLNLQDEVEEMPVLENPTAGILCAAPFSLDQQWYRAQVLDADEDITTVRFVDYGNTDVINNESTKIKTLPPNLLTLAVYATRSSLKISPVDGEWGANALKRFEDLIGESNITAQFIDQDEKTNYVELYTNGQNIKDILISENLAVPSELSVESKSTGFVSHLNSPSEFWLQLENCVDELEWIAEQLSGAENFPELEDTTPGTLCAALFPDDQMWYRARILSNTVAGLELLFIDYGNSSISTSLRQLPEDLVVTPPLAQKCSLQKPDGILYWTPEAANKFNEISADGQTIFTIHKISTGETSVVQLLLDGQDVKNMLLPDTEEGYVKTVESLDSLVIEKKGEVLPEEYKLEPLPGSTWTEESADKLKELSNQGTTTFQIEFIADHYVRLYVDGCDIRPNLGGIKTSTLNLSKTSTDDNKTDNEADISAYYNDTIPNDAFIEEIETISSYDQEVTTTSSSDIKYILGVEEKNLEYSELEKDIGIEIEAQKIQSDILLVGTDETNIKEKETEDATNINGEESEDETIAKSDIVPPDNVEIGIDEVNIKEKKSEDETIVKSDDIVPPDNSEIRVDEAIIKEKESEDETIVKSDSVAPDIPEIGIDKADIQEKESEDETIVKSDIVPSDNAEIRIDETNINGKESEEETIAKSDIVSPDNAEIRIDEANIKEQESQDETIVKSDSVAPDTPEIGIDKADIKEKESEDETIVKSDIVPSDNAEIRIDETNVNGKESEEETIAKSDIVSPDNAEIRIDEANIKEKESEEETIAKSDIVSPDNAEIRIDEANIKEQESQDETIVKSDSVAPDIPEIKIDKADIKEKESEGETIVESDSVAPDNAEIGIDKADIKEKESADETIAKSDIVSPDNAEIRIDEANIKEKESEDETIVKSDIVPSDNAEIRIDENNINVKKSEEETIAKSDIVSPDNVEIRIDVAIIKEKQSEDVITDVKSDKVPFDICLESAAVESPELESPQHTKHKDDNNELTPEKAFKENSEYGNMCQAETVLKNKIEDDSQLTADKITSEEVKQNTYQKLAKTPESSEKNTDEELMESEVVTILKGVVDKIAKQDANGDSRPVSRSSGKISHDDRIVPAVASRPHSPLEDEEEQEQPKSHPSSPSKISHDERVVPACLSRPHSPLPLSDDASDEK